ncbi:MAG: hypothetical protein P8H56_04215, partial [Crocinitomicaceae bacterium]|nr:hypothetical protein [Crocinitomicaceae bacterium]
VCAGAVVTLSGSGAGSYTWDNGALDGIGFNPLVGTVTYTVTGTDSNGCVATDQMVLIAQELPTVTINSQYDTLCESVGMVTLTGTPAEVHSLELVFQEDYLTLLSRELVHLMYPTIIQMSTIAQRMQLYK